MKTLVVLTFCLSVLMLSGTTSAQQSRASTNKPPEISRDLETLPSPVRRMRSLMLEAFRSGDLQKLKQPIETNELPPSFTRNTGTRQGGGQTNGQGGGHGGGAKGPNMAAELMKLFVERSGDGQGRETMGQLTNAFAVGHARIHAGSPQEMYVWPYLAVLDPRLLTAEQEVDAYRLFSAHTLREWREKGRYPGWRIGVGPDGTWHYLHGAD
jgi:hypothetical protein